MFPFVIFFHLALICLVPQSIYSDVTGLVRYPSVAGQFYPADREELSNLVDSLLAKAPSKQELPGDIVALISPHAGYVYAGQTAAHGYKLIAGKNFDTVILIGPCHRMLFPGASIWGAGFWKTPLGNVPVDTELAEAIIKENPAFTYTQEAHLAEHAIEVQLPFLQKVLKDFTIVPIAINTISLKEAETLAKAILKNIEGQKALIIATTDMSNYYPDATARQMDRLALSLLKNFDVCRLLEELSMKNIQLCGTEAVLTVLEIAKQIGNTSLEVLNYSNSGDANGNKNDVVGYSSSVIYKLPSPLSLTENQRL